MAQPMSDDEIDRLLADGRRYRSIVVVQATRASEDSEWTTGRGDVLHARAGDWWVSDGDETWSVAGPIFDSTYEAVGRDRFRKAALVKAVAVDGPFAVETLEGPATGEAGDFLVRNPTGECWPVRAEVFAARYVEV